MGRRVAISKPVGSVAELPEVTVESTVAFTVEGTVAVTVEGTVASTVASTAASPLRDRSNRRRRVSVNSVGRMSVRKKAARTASRTTALPEVSAFASMPAFLEKPAYQKMPIYRVQHEAMPVYPTASEKTLTHPGDQSRTAHTPQRVGQLQRVARAQRLQETTQVSPDRPVRQIQRRFPYGWLAIIATAIAVAIIIPRLETSIRPVESVSESQSTATTLALLQGIPIREKTSLTGYDRTASFGEAWADVDNNGCDTRNDILARDLAATEKSGACRVVKGTLVSPYTNALLDFDQKRDSTSLVQVDHVVSLANSWQTGAPQLTKAERISLANDPLNLLAADERSTSAKDSADAASWLPSNRSLRCAYVTTQVQVKAAYLLWMTQPEHDAIARELNRCP